MRSEASAPLVTVAIPSLNQGRFLEAALESLWEQNVSMEIMLADGGSTDQTPAVIDRWQQRLTWWRSAPDAGQAAAINDAIARGTAPYVCWLNADDTLLPGALRAMVDALHAQAARPALYANALFTDEAGTPLRPYPTEPFSPQRLAHGCFVSQPATLIRRSVWTALRGLDASLHYALDYDFWWRVYRHGGDLLFLDRLVATTRLHKEAKTMRHPARQWREAMKVVRRHYGSVPLNWYLRWPYSVGGRSVSRALTGWFAV